MKNIIILLSFLFCFTPYIVAQENIDESMFDFSSKAKIKKIEKVNDSPYAMFGDSTTVLKTMHERNLDHSLRVPLFENDKEIGLFKLNFQTGVVTIMDQNGHLVLNQELSHDQLSRFLTIDPLAEKYYNISPYVYVANNPIRNIDINGDSITVTNKKGEYLFMLDDGKNKMTTYTAQQLYSKGIQWFAADADNYMPLIGVANNLSKSTSFKHFTSDEILAFSEKDRWMIDYRSGGSGDW